MPRISRLPDDRAALRTAFDYDAWKDGETDRALERMEESDREERRYEDLGGSYEVEE